MEYEVGIVDEYGTVWNGEPGESGSKRIGDLVPRENTETAVLYLVDDPD